MSSISIVYRKDKLNKNGEAPIHFRIIKNRKVSYISSGIKIPENLWDAKNNRIKSKAQNSARLNSFINHKFTELQDQVLELETTSNFSTRQIKAKVMGRGEQDFFAFAQKIIDDYASKGMAGTFDKNSAVLSKLKTYVKDKPISFQDIDYNFLVKYETYLRTELKNKTNTISKNFAFVRKVFNEAYRQDIIEHKSNPFLKYKLKTEKTHKEYLNEEELKLIEEFSIESGTKLDIHRDMFVFACYAGGIRVSDVLKLKWSNYDGNHINWKMQKTRAQSAVKLPNKAVEILNKYAVSGQPLDDYIFPIFQGKNNLEDPFVLRKATSSATAYINKNLDILKTRINTEQEKNKKPQINKKITFHVSRHTWATRALRKGISIDKVSKLMGHAAIRETQIYAKIVNEELDKAMDAFN